MFIKTKREAFQSLLIKFQALRIFSSLYLMSWPGVELVNKKKRRASAPYWLIISIGSIPFPNDLDIFFPVSSRIKPWIKTSLNGFSSTRARDWKIILATQKKIMS